MGKRNATTTKRTVTILVRYFIKATKTVVLFVENDKGDRYYVTLQRNGQHSCTCPHVPSKKCPTCYHINHCREVENERAAKEVAAKRQAQRDQTTLSRHLAEQKAPVSTPGGADRGALSSNRGFHLLR